jgi:putative transposase
LIVEADGGPLGVVVAGANVNDFKLLTRTIEAIVVPRPDPEHNPQHLCLDKGYDNEPGETAALKAQYTPHIRRIGEEKLDDTGRTTHPARRWVVERRLRCSTAVARF